MGHKIPGNELPDRPYYGIMYLLLGRLSFKGIQIIISLASLSIGCKISLIGLFVYDIGKIVPFTIYGQAKVHYFLKSSFLVQQGLINIQSSKSDSPVRGKIEFFIGDEREHFLTVRVDSGSQIFGLGIMAI